ncbi:MAG TPA: dihydrodipicolinate synthase family protein [Chloroflexota bacterium]|jgi:dihydrodipicolinate synthase/N-acetylneuraminate lyase|nr:dihydrodipicolinate synthase family protein [Chloroflexota bacterium]
MNESAPPLQGIFPIIYTAFHADGRIDERGERRIVDYLIGAGCHGLAATGGASEAAKMTLDERKWLLEVCVEQAAGRVPLIMGCSTESLEDSIELVRHAGGLGVRAAFGLLPRAQQSLRGEELTAAVIAHYEALGQASEIPIMVQEVAQPIPPQAIVAVHERCPNVCYVKEEAPDTGHRLSALREASGDRLRIFSGGNNLLDDLARGAVGAIPGSIGVADLSTAFNRHQQGDRRGARQAFNHFLPLSHWRRQFGLLGAKEVMRRLGVIDGAYLRPPAEQHLDAYDLRELDEIMAMQGPPY